MGNVYHDLGCYNEAIAEFQRAIELDPKSDIAYTGLARVHLLLGQNHEAIASYQRAIELDSSDKHRALDHRGLGNTYHSMGRHDEAIAAYHPAIELDPKSAIAQISLAACYRKTGREAELTELVKIAGERISKESEYNRACFESISGNVDEALTLLKTALEKRQGTLEWARRDPDLDFIRDDPRFKALVGE